MSKKRYSVIVIVFIIALATSMLAGCGDDDLSPTADPTVELTIEPSDEQSTPESTEETTPEPTIYLYTRDGDYIYFGSYPQSEVTDETLKESLTNAAGDTGTWTSYDYYIDGEASDFMVYKDVSSKGEKYRGVYFTKYRPMYTTNKSSADYSYQDNNGYYANTVYWFKYEPIKWKILSESDGDVFLLSELLLDSQDYHYTQDTINDYNANDYEQSHIRAWLNDHFYNTAFSESEKAIIKETLVDNTNDKIFLLSYSEVKNGKYFVFDNNAVVKKPSDYSKAQGTTVYSGEGYWWLRSPASTGSVAAYAVDCEEKPNAMTYNVNATVFGVLPALHLDIS